jgi:hypothetical protein
LVSLDLLIVADRLRGRSFEDRHRHADANHHLAELGVFGDLGLASLATRQVDAISAIPRPERT